MWSWSSALTSGSTVETKFPLTLLPTELMADKAVFHAIQTEVARVVAWSHEVSEVGRYPAMDMYGAPFPPNSTRGRKAGALISQGWSGIYVGWKGDRLARGDVHLQVCQSSILGCPLCATKPCHHMPCPSHPY